MTDWIEEAKRVFAAGKPAHFTNHQHCGECAEHDATLLKNSPDSIGLEELGNPGWDPICFSSAEGIRYYLPALIRLSLNIMDSEFYLSQLLFHLESNGKDNDLYQSCNQRQRRFIAEFIEHLITTYPEALDAKCCQSEVLRTHDLWTKELGQE